MLDKDPTACLFMDWTSSRGRQLTKSCQKLTAACFGHKAPVRILRTKQLEDGSEAGSEITFCETFCAGCLISSIVWNMQV